MSESEVQTGISPVKTGKLPDGSWPQRIEIDNFVDPSVNPKQVFLFFAALTVLKKREASDPWSYFQIAGIHSLPWRQWPPIKGDKTIVSQYCPHGQPGFPGWHRVYCFQFERALHDIMMKWVKPQTEEEKSQSIIPPEHRDAYVEAAEKWRLPYWDVGLTRDFNNGNTCIPKCAAFKKISKELGNAWLALTHDSVKDVAPKWLQENTDNPLYSYKFPDDSEEFGVPLDKRHQPRSEQRETTRYPSAKDKGVSNIVGLQGTFADKKIYFRTQAIASLTIPTTFEEFIGTQLAAANLQDIHNNGHRFAGGVEEGGDMTFIAYAAFDPIFWLHHCNVDRLIALWQAAHTDPKDPSHWLSKEDDDKALKPFYDAEGDYWTSARVRHINNLGYSYPGLGNVNNEKTLEQNLNNMYTANDDEKRILCDVLMTAKFQMAEIGPFLIKFYYMKGDQPAKDSDPILGDCFNFSADIDAGNPCENCRENRANKLEVTLGTNISAGLLEDNVWGKKFGKWKLAEVQKRAEADLSKRLYWKVFQTKGNDDGSGAVEVEVPLEKLSSLQVVMSIGERTLSERGHGKESGGAPQGLTVIKGVTLDRPGGLTSGADVSWIH